MAAWTRRTATVVALLITLGLAGSAGASGHVTLNRATTTPGTAGDPVDITVDLTLEDLPDWLRIGFEGGVDFVEDVDPDAPSNGDVIGSHAMSARLPILFCIRTTSTSAMEWVSPISSGAPSGTTAEFVVASPTGGIPAYVVPDANGHDEVWIDYRGISSCSSDPRVELSITFYSHVNDDPNQPVVVRSTATGTYAVTSTTDDGSNTYSDSVAYTVN